MRTAYEYLATTNMIAQKFQLVVQQWWRALLAHETLNTGYTLARLRRTIMSQLDFMDWTVELQ